MLSLGTADPLTAMGWGYQFAAGESGRSAGATPAAAVGWLVPNAERSLVTHLFHHQTHHRGQITTLLSKQGVDIGSTDIPFMPRLDAA